MTEILAFLAAALDAAQRDAEAAAWCAEAQTWSVFHGKEPYERPWVITDGLDDGVAVVQAESSDNEGVAAHIARHDPTAVLRRIAADRKMIAEHSVATEVHDRRKEVRAGGSCYCHGTPMVAETVEVSWCMTCHDEDNAGFEAFWHGFQGGPCTTVRLLAEGWGWTEETT